jgi:hypothetical protein
MLRRNALRKHRSSTLSNIGRGISEEYPGRDASNGILDRKAVQPRLASRWRGEGEESW